MTINLDEYKYCSFAHDSITVANLASIRPELVKLICPILKRLEELGFQPRVAQGKRSLKDQEKAVKAGNSTTMKSKHLIGAAVDIVDKRYGWEGLASNLGFTFWREYGKLVTSTNGLRWGGDWGKGYTRYLDYIAGKTSYFVDVAHAELSKVE